MSSWGTSGPAFSSEMNRLLGQAESALLGRRSAPVTKRDAYDAQRASSALAVAHAPTLSEYHGGVSGGAMMTEDLTRHVLVCMNEIRELRHELALEREARSTVMTAFAKRIKEEISGDVRSTEHHMQRTIREMEADLIQRITEQDNARALMKRTVDDALRQVKLYDRTQFDATEQHREQLDELRSNVAQCVGLCHQVRSEVAQKLEREAAAHAHRLDVELTRYADMQRQNQQSLADTRRSVADEVSQVSKTIGAMVDECWQRRLATMSKTVDDSLLSMRTTHERQEQRVSDMSVKMAQFSKDVRSEIVLATGDVKDRLAALESTVPLLSSRVDRFERKADSVFETANKLTAQTDVIQQTCDKMTVQVTRSVERCQKLEDGVRERDDRIVKCESQLSALTGLERLKVDVEGIRKAVTRVEGGMDHIKQIADRDERLVDAMQRNIDGSVERADAVEKKAHKVIARVETAEQRIMGFVDRLISLEESSERQTSSVDQSKMSLELLSQRVSATEGRQRSVIDRVEQGFKEVADRLGAVEGRADAAADSSSRFDSISAAARKDVERLEKRIGKVESSTSNVLDNLRETRDVVDIVQREHSTTSKKLDQWKETLDRKTGVLDTKLSEFDSIGTSLGERFVRNDKRVAALMEAQEKRIEERVDMLAKRMDEIHTASSRRHTQEIVSSANRGGSVVDETLAMEVGASRRRIDGLEARLRQIENQNAARIEDTVQRHELTSVSYQLKALETAWRQLQDRMSGIERSSMGGVDQRLRTEVVHHVPAPSMPVVDTTPDISPVQQHRPSSILREEHEQFEPASAPVSGHEPARSPIPVQRTLISQPPADSRSSVSSMHGDLAMDDVSEVTSIGRTTQQEIERQTMEASAKPGGLPPLSDGTQRVPPPPGTTSAVPPKDVAKKRSPYSDTSESERDAGGAFTSPDKGTPAKPYVAALPPPSATIADDFDDDEGEFYIADNSATFKLEDTLTHGKAAPVAQKPSTTAAAATPEMTTDDDLAGALFGRRQSSQRRRDFLSAGDTSSAGELMVPTGDAPPVAGEASVVAQPKKFHAKKSGSAARSSFDEDSDEVDEADDVGALASSPREGGSQARSKGSSRRSAGSRRTTDVSLSLNSSRKQPGSRRRGDEETVEDIEDDDQLAEMLGFLDKKGKKK